MKDIESIKYLYKEIDKGSNTERIDMLDVISVIGTRNNKKNNITRNIK